MHINELNELLKSKNPAAKQAPVATNKPDTAPLKQRIAHARKQIGMVDLRARRLNSPELVKRIRELRFKLSAMEAELAKISKP